MNKDEYLLLEVNEQLKLVNDLLAQGQNVTKVAYDLGIDRKTITRNFKKISYAYDSITKQYAKTNVSQYVKDSNSPNIDKETVNKTRNVSKPGNKIGNISDSIVISKLVSIPKPKRNSYYLNINTTKKLEKLAKESNKGISEFLQELLDVVLDKVEIK